MQPFIRNGKTYWGGLHRVLGLVIYDPQRQHHLTDEKVRLYIVEERRMATFVKHIVRANLGVFAQPLSCHAGHERGHPKYRIIPSKVGKRMRGNDFIRRSLA